MTILKFEVDLNALFWDLFELLPNNKKDEFCGDSEFEFDNFRNSIKLANNEELITQIKHVVELLSNKDNKITSFYLDLLKDLYDNSENDNT